MAQRVGHRVLALAGDHLAQLGLEVEDLEAVVAAVEVVLDAHAELVVSLAVEVRDTPRVNDVVAVSHGLARSRRSVFGRAVDRCRAAGRLGPRRSSHNCVLSAFSSPMQPAHHRADRNVEDLGDLLVREALDVGQQHRHAELLGQRLEGLLHLGVGEPVEQLVLGAATGQRRLEAAEPAVEVEVLDVVEVGLARAGASWPGSC